MRFKSHPVFLLWLFIMVMPLASANSTDTQQPISIEADRAELDDKSETSTYQGNVILQQGGIKITADKLNVFTQDGELQRITAEGSPVEFFQNRENQENIHGSSLNIEYDAKTRRFLLLNNAELWQGKNLFSGERIQFDPENEKVIATGDPDKSGDNSNRVQITIQPKPREKKP